MTRYRSATSLNCHPKYSDAGSPSSAIIESIMLSRRLSSRLFPRKKTFHFHWRKSPPSPGDFWLASGTWRNVITCAYLFGVSHRPRWLNSNTFLDSSNCGASPNKQSTCFGSTLDHSSLVSFFVNFAIRVKSKFVDTAHDGSFSRY